MANATLSKIGAWIAVAIAVMAYPAVLISAAVWMIYHTIVGKAACKSIVGDVAVITGAARGLGKCIATKLAQNGCHVAIVDVRIDEAENTAKSIAEKFQVKAKAYKVDVTNYEEIVTLNEKVTNDLGPASILVNNAGLVMHKDQLNPDWRDVQNMINVNLTAHFWTNSVFLSGMKKMKRGHIVAINSVAGLFPLMYSGTYSATKFGVRALMEVLRMELKLNPKNSIHTTTVFPSFLQTHEEVAKIAKRIGIDILYPLISGDEVAERVVHGMLRNEEEITLPAFFSILHRLYGSLPAAWRDGIGTKSSLFDKAFEFQKKVY